MMRFCLGRPRRDRSRLDGLSPPTPRLSPSPLTGRITMIPLDGLGRLVFSGQLVDGSGQQPGARDTLAATDPGFDDLTCRILALLARRHLQTLTEQQIAEEEGVDCDPKTARRRLKGLVLRAY